MGISLSRNLNDIGNGGHDVVANEIPREKIQNKKDTKDTRSNEELAKLHIFFSWFGQNCFPSGLSLL